MTDQKVAIVTGGSSGIGRATAVALAKQGVKVTVAARRAKEAGNEGIFVKTDVANEDNVKSLVEKTVKMYDRLDYAFNNAAIPEITTPSNVFDQIMNVNVKGVWLCMKYEIPEMIRSGGGAIVNTSSGAGVEEFHNSQFIARANMLCLE